MAAVSAPSLCRPVGGKESATPWAGFGERLKVGGKLAVRIVTAPIEGALLFAYPFYYLTAALGAFDAGLYLVGLGIFTIGVASAGEKLTVAAAFNSQGFTTLGAAFLS